MKFARIYPLVAIAALCSAVPVGAQTKIATVNPASFIEQLTETKDLAAKIKADQDEYAKKNALASQKLQDLRTAQSGFRVNTKEYNEFNTKIVQAAVDLNVQQQLNALTIQSAYKQGLLKIYNDILDAVNEIAKERGVDLVITEQQPSLQEAAERPDVDMPTFRSVVNSRNVLFSTPSVDLSELVRARVEQKYKVVPGATPPKP